MIFFMLADAVIVARIGNNTGVELLTAMLGSIAMLYLALRVFLYQKLGMPYLLCMGLMLVLGFLIPYAVIRGIVERNVHLSRVSTGKW